MYLYGTVSQRLIGFLDVRAPRGVPEEVLPIAGLRAAGREQRGASPRLATREGARQRVYVNLLIVDNG